MAALSSIKAVNLSIGDIKLFISIDVYEVRPRKDHRGVDLISDALPFGHLWDGEPNATRKRSRVRHVSQPLT